MSAHTAQTELKLIGKLILEGEMHCETGLHVGAGKGSLEIGGSDNPVVKDAFGRPYVPGSSLRGKIRALLEQSSGLAVPSELVYLSRRKGQEVRIHHSDRPDDEVCILFGRNPGRMERVSGDAIEAATATPARLTVYDAPLVVDSITPQMRENLDDELTEVKSENAVDRITSQANPRTLERVPAGARFRFRMVLDVLCSEDKPLLARVAEALRLLEDDALGGGGSRGSGRISFTNLNLAWRGKEYYASGAAEASLLTSSNVKHCSNWSVRKISAGNPSKHAAGCLGSPPAIRPVAIWSGRWWPQPPGYALPKRPGLFRPYSGHASARLFGGLAGRNRSESGPCGRLHFVVPVSGRGVVCASSF